MRSFKTDISRSENIFNTKIKQKLESMLASKIEVLENFKSDSSDLYKVFADFDKFSGVDGWRVMEHNGDKKHQFIAHRVQYIQDGRKPYNSFTIRTRRIGRRTEYEKRLEAIEKEWLYPQITIQSYVTELESEILSIGIVYTKDLILYLKDNWDKYKELSNYDKKTFFKVLPWDDIKHLRFKLYEFTGVNV